MNMSSIEEQVLKFCTEGLVTIEDLQTQLKEFSREKIVESVEYLLNEGKIIDIEFKENNTLVMKYSNFHDYITKEPELTKIIKEDDILNEFLSDKNFKLIISLLRTKSMTIKDLTRCFKLNGIKKSEKTVWHYVNKLVSKNIVIEVGQRIVKGRSSNEKLFRSAYYIYYHDYDPLKGLNGQKGEKIAQITRDLLLIYFKDKKLEKEEVLLNLLKNIETQQHEIMIKLFEKLDRQTALEFSSLETEEVNNINHIIGWLIWLIDVNVSDPEIESLRYQV